MRYLCTPRLTTALILSLGFWSAMGSHAARAGEDWVVSTTLTPNPAQTTDLVTLTLMISSGSGKSPEDIEERTPDFTGFMLVGKNSHTQVIEVQPGVAREALIFRYTLRPLRAGTRTIPEIVITAQGSVLKSTAIDVKVVPPGKATRPVRPTPVPTGHSPINKPGDDFFLQVESKPATSVYVGEPVFVRYDLFRQGAIGAGLYDAREPDFEDFWPHNATDSNQRTGSGGAEQIEGKFYQRELIRAYVLVPLSSGPHEIAPIEAEVRRDSSAKRWIASEAISIEVKPLPPDPPEGFKPSNVTPRVSLQVELAASGNRTLDEVRVGDSLTLTAKLSGHGAISQMSLVELKSTPALEIFGPTDAQREDKVDREQLKGIRRMNFTVIPLEEGTLELPKVRFVYFDPSTGRYEELNEGPWRVKIAGFAPNATQVLDQLKAERAHQKTASEPQQPALLAPLRTIELETLTARGSAHYQSIWFLILMGFPPVFYVGLLLFDRGRRRREEQSDELRSRGALKTSIKALRAARKLPDGSREQLDAIERSVREYLEARYELRSRSKTGGQLERALDRAGASESSAQGTAALLSELEQQRYAPAGLTGSSEGFAGRAQILLEALESERED